MSMSMLLQLWKYIVKLRERERVREGLGRDGSPKANFGQPSPGTNIKFGCPTHYHHHYHWKSHYPQEPKVHHIAKMRKTIKDFLEDGTRKTRGAPCEAAERRQVPGWWWAPRWPSSPCWHSVVPSRSSPNISHNSRTESVSTFPPQGRAVLGLRRHVLVIETMKP